MQQQQQQQQQQEEEEKETAKPEPKRTKPATVQATPMDGTKSFTQRGSAKPRNSAAPSTGRASVISSRQAAACARLMAGSSVAARKTLNTGTSSTSASANKRRAMHHGHGHGSASRAGASSSMAGAARGSARSSQKGKGKGVPGYKKFDLAASLKRKPTWQMKKGKIRAEAEAEAAAGAMGAAGAERPKIGQLKSRKPLGARASNMPSSAGGKASAASSSSSSSSSSVSSSAAAMASALL